MARAARRGDAVAGMTAGEHSGHYDEYGNPEHGAMPLSGEISGNTSGNVFINGRAAATAGSLSTERDGCCGSSQGSVRGGSASVAINGAAAARQGDALNAHNGSGSVTGGSGDVFIGS